MSETQWEYCRLQISGAKEHKKGAFLGLGGESQGYGYNCFIVYYSPSGESIIEKLTANTEPTDWKPFSTAMGFLGASEWELVNVQHGNLAATATGEVASRIFHWDILSWDCVVAYFKRSVLPNRAVNEPKFVLQKK
jgi:hypothetical protein